MTRRRPDIDRSRAVLIGVSRYETDEQSTADLSEALPSLESVSANLSDLGQLLTEPDLGTFAPQHCTLVENPQLAEIGDVLVRAAREAEDVLLVYYSGHGLVDSRGRLYLGLPGSSQTRAAWKALPFETLREDLLDSPAKIRVLILDCCFSGRAFESMSDADTLQANQFRINGTFTLTSSAANEPSFAPLGEIHTAFTGALLSLARQTPGLTLDELYGAVQGHLSALGRPAPRRRSVDEAGDLVIFGHPHQSRSAAGIEVERFERTYEFDEARRVAPRVNPTSGLPGFWDVTVRNGSATPIAQLEADVYPVDATGSRIEDECVTAKGHRMLWKTLSDRNRAEVRGKVNSSNPHSGTPFAEITAATMEDFIMNIVSPITSQQIARPADCYPDPFPAGAEETVVYYAPNAATVRANLTFTDTSGNRWTRSHDQRPRLVER
ncbi:caspase family protein [Nocardia sp. NBC_01377]|uniref:caspase family protein n=1 Tax=Nocardia sp. NBC_01377 TaxID=2903595 RepID=UPI003256303B